MESAVGRVGVLGRTGRAQREGGHRRRRPVVWQAGDDGEPWAAVGATDERVPIAAILGRPVRRDSRRRWRCLGRSASVRRRLAGSVIEKPVPPWVADHLNGDRVDPRQGSAHQSAADVRNSATATAEPSISIVTPLLSLRPIQRGRTAGPARKRTGGIQRLARHREDEPDRTRSSAMSGHHQPPLGEQRVGQREMLLAIVLQHLPLIDR